jgi:hypothetical protein
MQRLGPTAVSREIEGGAATVAGNARRRRLSHTTLTKVQNNSNTNPTNRWLLTDFRQIRPPTAFGSTC